jgi:hypothetical protein
MAELQSVIVMSTGGHLPHDPDGKLLRMGHEATALALSAQMLHKSDPARKQKYERRPAFASKRRKDGWLSAPRSFRPETSRALPKRRWASPATNWSRESFRKEPSGWSSPSRRRQRTS